MAQDPSITWACGLVTDDGGGGFAAGAVAKENAPAGDDAGFVVIGVTVKLPGLNGLAAAAAGTGLA